MAATFLEAILDQGINNPNFFNGKVLTARDLRDLQTSTAQRARRLGQAIGEGVAYGLFVERASNTTLGISAGLAINRRGDALLLPTDITLPLQATTQASAPLDSPFAPCDTVPITTSITTGYLLLAITSATELSSEMAQHTGLNSANPTCISRYEIEGIQIKIIPIEATVFTPTGSEALHRSQLALACFGTTTLQGYDDDPFHMPAHYGLIDNLRASGKLLDCDVPLAVLHWSGSQIRFVDQWSVRRACVNGAAAAAYPPGVNDVQPFPQHTHPRRAAEARAMLLQFQNQLAATPKSGTVVQHFVFLPSAGYLPLGPGGFNLSTFFPNNPATLRDLDPAFVRLVFEQSLYIAPVPVVVGQAVDVEFFRVTGAGSGFIIFARREQVVIQQPDDDEPTEPGPVKDGTIVVRITDPNGKTLLASDITSVKVANAIITSKETVLDVLYQDSAPTYNVSTQNQVRSSYTQAKKNARTSPYIPGLTENDVIIDDIGIDIGTIDIAVYTFKRPPGTYTVSAVPNVKTGLRANSTIVKLGSGQTKEVTLALLPRKTRQPPGSSGGVIVVDPDDPFVLNNGHNVRDMYAYVDWFKIFGYGPYGPGDVDPPPDDWEVELPGGVREQIEDMIGQYAEFDPTIAAEDVTILVSPDYDPNVVQTDPYAFAQTADGYRFPLIFGAGDHAITGDVAVGRSGLADLDAASQNMLNATGLGSLNAFNGAWTGLIGDVLGIDAGGAGSMMTETRAAAGQFVGSFTRYTGVSIEADGALKSGGFTDDVALANASADDVLAALNSVQGANYSEGFAIRLIDRARGNVPGSAWSLGALGLSSGQVELLGEMGITSAGQFAGSVNDSFAEIKEALNVTETALDLMVNEARAGAFGTRLQQAGGVGVANVEGVGGEFAGVLVSAGYKTAADLSNANVAELAELTHISEAEALALKQSASEKVGTYTLLQAEFGLEDDEVRLLMEAGIVGAGDIVAGGNIVADVVGDRAGTLTTVVDLALNKRGMMFF